MPKLLVIDDVADTVEVIKLMFELEGFEVIGVYDHYNLLATIADFSPDVIILDVHLAGKDGRDISKLLKTGKSTREIPIVLMSASEHLHDAEKSYPADAYIAKPFDIDDIVNTVKGLLK